MSDADLVAGGNVNFGRELERDEWKEKIRKLLVIVLSRMNPKATE